MWSTGTRKVKALCHPQQSQDWVPQAMWTLVDESVRRSWVTLCSWCLWKSRLTSRQNWAVDEFPVYGYTVQRLNRGWDGLFWSRAFPRSKGLAYSRYTVRIGIRHPPRWALWDQAGYNRLRKTISWQDLYYLSGLCCSVRNRCNELG